MKKVLHFTTSLLLVLFITACSTEIPESEEIEATPVTQEEQETPALKQTVSTPVFSVESGEVSSGTITKITSSTEGAVIYYTTDNSDPTEKSNKYTNQITIVPPMTIKAIAVKDGMNNSTVAEVVYTKPTEKQEPPAPKQTVSTPIFSVESGEVSSGTTTEITCSTEGAAIYYTTDGSVPTVESSRYTAPITITPPMTLKAIAIKDGMNNSAVTEVVYTESTVDYFEKLGNFYSWCYGVSNVNFGSYIVRKVDENKAYINLYRDNQAGGEPVYQEKLSYSVSGNIASLKGESGTEFAININTKEFVTKKIVFKGNVYDLMDV